MFRREVVKDEDGSLVLVLEGGMMGDSVRQIGL